MKSARTSVIYRRKSKRSTTSRNKKTISADRIVFSDVEAQARKWADYIEAHFEELVEILLEYESFEVVQDEVARTLDHLRSLKENKNYFKFRVGAVTAFLPRNQPLYALTCFVLIPSLMAREVHFRIPHAMRNFFPQMLKLLKVLEFFHNVHVSPKQRLEFLQERSAVRIDPKTLDSIPVTDAVIFTGTSSHADQLRSIFDNRTLFIANGAGHNPFVVAADADLAQAVEAALILTLYNQGQDCAAPNSILVHKSVVQDFLRLLHGKLLLVRVGHYRDRMSRVGPISDPNDLVRLEKFLIDHQRWIDHATPGIIRTRDAILEPTVIRKPLSKGGNITEIFAPIIFVQEYATDSNLKLYFEDKKYAQNAMYIMLYGTSSYLKSFVGRKVDGKLLHDRASLLHNTHLHAPGVERGTQPYGGYGYSTSSLSMNGKIISKPTLPQRDIYQWLIKPRMRARTSIKYRHDTTRFTIVKEKNVEKLLRLKINRIENTKYSPEMSAIYVDLEAIQKGKRYAVLDNHRSFRLLTTPNVECIAGLGIEDLRLIRSIRTALMKKKNPRLETFTSFLYNRAKDPNLSKKENHIRQKHLFQQLYQLLLGEKSGPRLAQFLLEIDRTKVIELLDV